MYFICDRCHAARKLLLIHYEMPIIASSVRPAVIKNYIIVSDVSQARVDELFRSIKEQRFRYVAPKRIPIVLKSRVNHSWEFLGSKAQLTHPICGVLASPLLTATAFPESARSTTICVRTMILDNALNPPQLLNKKPNGGYLKATRRLLPGKESGLWLGKWSRRRR